MLLSTAAPGAIKHCVRVLGGVVLASAILLCCLPVLLLVGLALALAFYVTALAALISHWRRRRGTRTRVEAAAGPEWTGTNTTF